MRTWRIVVRPMARSDPSPALERTRVLARRTALTSMGLLVVLNVSTRDWVLAVAFAFLFASQFVESFPGRLHGRSVRWITVGLSLVASALIVVHLVFEWI